MISAADARKLVDDFPHLEVINNLIEDAAKKGLSSVIYNVSSMTDVKLGVLSSELRYMKYGLDLRESRTLLLIVW